MTEPPQGPSSPSYRRWVEIALSLLALCATVMLVGAKALVARLRALDGGWVAVALGIACAQFVLLGARWWFLAGRVGVPLSYGRALREYYLSSLLNYVGPFGAFGDAMRGVRHADHAAQTTGDRPLGRVFLALLLDRASGQLVLWLVVLTVATPGLGRAVSMRTGSSLHIALFAGVAFLAVAIGASAASATGRRWIARLREGIAQGTRTLFLPANLVVHVPLSFVLLGTHVALFMVAARATHLELELGAATRLVPPILAAATVPTFLGGFGIREAAAAGLYHLSGMPAADGAAISFVYGTLELAASVPAVLALPWRRR
jgi:uncharacterized membrane protein YbhN (UPF0104 family)